MDKNARDKAVEAIVERAKQFKHFVLDRRQLALEVENILDKFCPPTAEELTERSKRREDDLPTSDDDFLKPRGGRFYF